MTRHGDHEGGAPRHDADRGAVMPSRSPVELFVTLHGRDDAYVMALAAMYASMRSHTAASLRFTIVHDASVRQDSLDRVAAFIRERDEAHLVNIEAHPDIDALARECADARYSPAVLWRVFAPDLMPDSAKVLLVDADLVFLCDVLRLWEVDVSNAAIAAVRRGKPWPAEYHDLIETPSDRYFRIGLSVLNLQRMRQDERFRTTRASFLRTRLPAINALVCLPEQSVFNYFFSGSARPLEATLVPAGHFNPADERAVARLLGTMDCGGTLVLDLKGWQHRSPFDYFYWSYLLLTPWRAQAYAELVAHQRGGRPSHAG
ncbi:MAG: glycosyltransferase [Vicinamibacterales bacterium]